MKKQFIFILLLNFAFSQTDSLWTEVSGDTVTIHHDNTERNCGAFFDFSITFLDSNIIEIAEVDTGDMAFCNCEFDLELVIGGLSVGTWIAEIYGQDLDNNGETEYYGSVEFTIGTQGGTEFVVSGYQSPCNTTSEFFDYFPLEIGNEWIYHFTNNLDSLTSHQTITDIEIDTMENIYYKFDSYCSYSENVPPNYFRWDGSWVWGWFGPGYDNSSHSGTDSLNFPMFKFDAVLNESWDATFKRYMYVADFTMVPMRLVSKTDTVETDIDTFYDCYHFVASFGYGDVKSFWFAEGVGMVKSYDFYEGSSDTEWLLLSTNVLSNRRNEVLPNKVNLYPAYPNPFNPTTTIRINVDARHASQLQIFDITGRLVDELVRGELVSGEHKIIWNAGNLPSGVYFVRLISAGISRTQKVILMK